MIRVSTVGALVAAAIASSACSMMPMSGSAAPAVTSNGVLVSAANKMTLYTFDRDPAGGTKSACYAACATNWPPFTSADATASGDWTVLVRDDGVKQYVYKGKPLYYWAKDMKPGDKTGDGVNNVWHAVTP